MEDGKIRVSVIRDLKCIGLMAEAIGIVEPFVVELTDEIVRLVREAEGDLKKLLDKDKVVG